MSGDSAQALLRTPPWLGAPLSSKISGISTETLLGRAGWESQTLLARARAAIQAMTQQRIGGDCFEPETSVERSLPRCFLLLSLEEARPDDEALERAVGAARDRSNGFPVVVIPPRNKRARARLNAMALPGWQLIEEPINPWPLLDRATNVLTLGGETGFIALLRGLDVRCFADCFYSGWGLTKDALFVARRPRERRLAEIVAAECLVSTSYLDPYTGKPGSFESAFELVAQWRALERKNLAIAACMGMSFWKRKTISAFFRSKAGTPKFTKSVGAAIRAARRRNGAIAVWNSRVPKRLEAKAASAGIRLVRVEDGFLRSVGLGADFVPGASIVADERGIYYDSSRESDLAHLLETSVFDSELIARARLLSRAIVARGLSKCNVGGSFTLPDRARGLRSVLVPGQVEDDRAVTLAGGLSNLALLERVRAHNPDAFVIFKPHPDVVAGHRRGAVSQRAIARFADLAVRDAAMPSLLEKVDEVHTLSSLAGFEALLHRRRVVTYGTPFYAGYGLTVDLAAPRRKISLSLDALVAGTLILYPRYVDPKTLLPCSPELLIERMADEKLWRPTFKVRARRMQGRIVRGAAHLRGPAWGH